MLSNKGENRVKLLQFIKNQQTKLGVKTARGILDVAEAAKGFRERQPEKMHDIVLQGKDGIRSLKRFVEKIVNESGESTYFLDEDDIQYRPVIEQPGKIICVGLNYVDHANESKMDLPTSPILFSKFNNALAAHKEPIPIPEVTEKCDYEAELVLVIGQTAKNVSEEEALSYVFGYTIGNDLSARDLQFKTGQWLLGKSLDRFAPIGPYIVTEDEIDCNNLVIECKVNGETRQHNNTKNMIFNCAQIISYASKHMTLNPGDIIFTGTPDGVILGYPPERQKWLQANDKIEVSIEHIGTLTNVLV